MPRSKRDKGPIRLLHFSDLHLGIESYGRLDPATGLSSRIGDFLRALDKVVEYALTEGIHLALFTGDAYKDRDPSPTLQREFAKRIHRLAEKIPVFLLVGNHDRPRATGKAHSVEIFSTLRVPGVYVAAAPETHTIPTPAGPVQILALPWSRALAHSDAEPEVLQKVEDFIKEAIVQLDPQVPAVLAAHALVSGGVFGSERSVLLGQELVLPKSLVSHPALAYVALGHLHQHQVLGEKPAIVYAGSLERVDFGEEKEEKGFVVVEIQGGQASFQFIPLPVRPFVTIRTTIKEGKDPTAQVVESIAKRKIAGAVVRVIIQISPQAAPLIREEEIRKVLEPAFFVAAVSKEVEWPVRLRLGGDAQEIERLTPAELLARYLEAKKVPRSRRKIIMDYAKKIMEPEE